MLIWFKKHENFVTARIVDIVDDDDRPHTEVSESGLRWFKVMLQDKDHQSLIDTIDKVWPTWKDGDITMAHQMEEIS